MQLDDEYLLTCTIHEPVEGRWWADVALSAGDPLSGRRALTIGSAVWSGTIVDPTTDGQRRRARVIGGANGLDSPVTDRYYRGSVTLGQIATDLLASVGETLDPASDLLTRTMPTWQRFAGPAREALTDLVLANKLAWRVTRAGLVRLEQLPHAFIVAIPPGTLLEDDGRSIAIAVESPDIEPGVTVDGHKIHRIMWEATASRVTGYCFYQDAPELRRVQDHRSIAEAGIDSQAADGSLSVIAASRYGLTDVPLYSGLPGVDVEVQSGRQTLVAWAGSPRRPIAVGHRGGSGGLKIGSLVFVTAIVSGAPVVVGAQFFNADEAGEAAAATLGAPPNILVPLTFTTAVEQ